MFRINHIWAFLAIGDDDEEGVIGADMGGVMMPLIAANEERLDNLRPYARSIARVSGKKVTLVKFTVREKVEEIDGLPY